MKTTCILIKRNIKMFFADKGLFFTSLITPMILLVLYITFLGNVYRDVYDQVLGPFDISKEIINSFVASHLVSSLLAVTAVTVSFCSNMLMVQDKFLGMKQDMSVSPIKRHVPAIAYFVASFVVTYAICLVAVAGGFIYIASMGWYLTAFDVALILLDVALLVMFGTALSSLINFFLSSQGQISAVGSIVSSCYGFICGAYMPLSQFPEWLQKVIAFLPGTYGTSILRNRFMRGSIEQINKHMPNAKIFDGVPAAEIEKQVDEQITLLRDSVDCNIYFFDHSVEIWQMYLILGGFTVLILAAYILLNIFSKKRVKK